MNESNTYIAFKTDRGGSVSELLFAFRATDEFALKLEQWAEVKPGGFSIEKLPFLDGDEAVRAYFASEKEEAIRQHAGHYDEIIKP